MDGNGHHRRRAPQPSRRQALQDDSQYGGSKPQGPGQIRENFAVPTQNSVRSSQVFSQATSSASIYPSVSAQDFGEPGYAQVQQFAPHRVHGPSSTYQSGYPQLSQREQQISQYSPQAALSAQQPAQAQGHSHLSFGNSAAYQQRQSAAVEVLSNQFSSQTYYDSGQGQAQASLSSHPTVAIQQSIQYTSSGEFAQQSLPSTYASGDATFTGATGYDHVWQQEQSEPEAEDPQACCENLLRQTNSLTLDDRLLEARSSLLELMQYLLDNIETLEHLNPDIEVGLHEDKVIEDNREWRVSYKQRLKFWSDIHNAWLVFLQRQFDNTRHPPKGSRSSRPKNLLRKDLEELREEVLKLADQFDKYGLLNYEQGFQPDELMPYLKKCYKELGSGDSKSGGRRK
ncbi:uncharacterized protein KY384_003760 [Bacidia gigantensis]|uniref:uncharacterized protein n=1 Tax=Bacidia gigantensis TaxID=2732470 RepID=UPI001D043318|nr:uncharacterized protein KY384_003760 [Bacidia gigantensis]KAG8532123.1 hypothetical protein KY384_003760 [Bacidia gigantensis]